MWQSGPVPQVDVLQQMFVAAAPPAVVAGLCRTEVRHALWPDLEVTLGQDRGAAGQRYLVRGRWHGSAELWLPACADGVLVHSYLRLDRPWPLPARRCRREQRRRSEHMRRTLWALKDQLEAGRAPGDPAVPVPDAAPPAR